MFVRVGDVPRRRRCRAPRHFRQAAELLEKCGTSSGQRPLREERRHFLPVASGRSEEPQRARQALRTAGAAPALLGGHAAAGHLALRRRAPGRGPSPARGRACRAPRSRRPPPGASTRWRASTRGRPRAEARELTSA
jgi:hypothetical protein